MAELPNDSNDSSQMKALLQDDQSGGSPKERPRSDAQAEGGDGVGCASLICIPFCSSSSSSPCDKRVARGAGSGTAAPGTSSCVSLDDLRRRRDKLDRLNFSKTHTVLINVAHFNTCGLSEAQWGREVWLSNFVKMPCSSQSLFASRNGGKAARWPVIEAQLKALARKKEVGVEDVKRAIFTYNPKYKHRWTFEVLSSLVECMQKFEYYVPALFPKIAELALNLQRCVTKAIPLLQSGHTSAITLSQVQISCLLANAFFCTFPHRNTSGPNAEYGGYPSINFNSLFGPWSEHKREKLRAIMHYFKVVTNQTTKPQGLVTFERRCMKEFPSWKTSKKTLCKLHVTSQGSIEADGKGLLQVDFASSWIGGGVLGSGMVQEEILFVVNPELIVSRLFTEKLADNECLIITGSQQFSEYSGFRDSFEWAGPHEDTLGRDEWQRLKRQIVAIDALHFTHPGEQYTGANVTRELNKAFCGFKGEGPDIATGKWGCGAFNGDPQLKALIQLTAAAEAKRGLAFFTFGDDQLMRSLQQIYHLLVTERITVEKLYERLLCYCNFRQSHRTSHMDLFDYVANFTKKTSSLL